MDMDGYGSIQQNPFPSNGLPGLNHPTKVFEERQKRFVTEVEAERLDGDQRVQRLRNELRRMEQAHMGKNVRIIIFQDLVQV